MVCSFLIQACNLTVEEALQSFAAARPPGVRYVFVLPLVAYLSSPQRLVQARQTMLHCPSNQSKQMPRTTAAGQHVLPQKEDEGHAQHERHIADIADTSIVCETVARGLNSGMQGRERETR